MPNNSLDYIKAFHLFHHLQTKLHKLENQLLAIQERCDNQGDAVNQIVTLTELVNAVGVALDNVR